MPLVIRLGRRGSIEIREPGDLPYYVALPVDQDQSKARGLPSSSDISIPTGLTSAGIKEMCECLSYFLFP